MIEKEERNTNMEYRKKHWECENKKYVRNVRKKEDWLERLKIIKNISFKIKLNKNSWYKINEDEWMKISKWR